MCCDNPINLGCVSSCESVTTDFVVTCSGAYTIQYEFNGATISYTMQANEGFLTIPAGVFNEDYNTTFKVKDMSGQVIGCYKVNVTPSVGSPIQSSGASVLTSNIELIKGLCTTGMPNGTQECEINILLSDSDLLQAGTTIDLVVNIDPELTYGLTSLNTGAYTILGDTITIVDPSEIVDNTINLSMNIIVSASCNTSFESQVSVGCYNNLPTTTILGVQIPSNTIIS